MLQVTDPALQNLMYLRDVTIPWMMEHPEQVDLDRYNSDCGTYGCLLGWYSMQRFGEGVIAHAKNTESSSYPYHWSWGEFGLNPKDSDIDWSLLFGYSKAGNLKLRLRRVEQHIAKRLAALEMK